MALRHMLYMKLKGILIACCLALASISAVGCFGPAEPYIIYRGAIYGGYGYWDYNGIWVPVPYPTYYYEYYNGVWVRRPITVARPPTIAQPPRVIGPPTIAYPPPRAPMLRAPRPNRRF